MFCKIIVGVKNLPLHKGSYELQKRRKIYYEGSTGIVRQVEACGIATQNIYIAKAR